MVQAAPEMVEEIEEVERVPKGVIQNMADLENKLIMALNADVKKLLVTPGIIRAILQQRYKDDPYMIYRNVELYDYNRVEETELRNAETINDRIFGKSKVNIGSNPPPQGPAA